MILCMLAGCVAVPHTEQPAAGLNSHPVAPANFPAHIAVLPLINDTSTSVGPTVVRALAVRKIGFELGFIVPSASEIDNTLDGRDLMWSGHPGRQPLERQDPALLASWLGVEGLLHGEVQGYSKSQLGFYGESNVTVRFWLTDSTGHKIWEGAAKGGGSGIVSGSVSPQGIFSDGSIPPDAADVMRNSDLTETAMGAVDDAFTNFPRHF